MSEITIDDLSKEQVSGQLAAPEIDEIVTEGRSIGHVDRDGNIRLGKREDHGRIVGHIANDREHAISVLHQRFLSYLSDTLAWCDESRSAENRLWRLREINSRLREIYQQYVLGDLSVVGDALNALKTSLQQEQQARIDARSAFIEHAHHASTREDWKDASMAFDQLNGSFKSIGTAGDRDIDHKQWAALKEHEHTFRLRRKAHFDAIDRERGERAAAKALICEEAEQLQDSDEFKTAGQSLRDLMDQWKAIGFAGKPLDEQLWLRFQTARAHFNARREVWFGANAEKKALILGEAKQIELLEDAVSAQVQMKQLMQRWREVGSAGKQADDALWVEFRAAQDSVFQRSKIVFDARQHERDENYRRKQALINDVESLLAMDSGEATSRCKEYQRQWKEIGQAPREFNEAQWQRFRIACDRVFQLASERGKERLQEARDRAEAQIYKLNAEIDEHESKIAHWEGVIANLRNGDGAEEIRAAMHEKVAAAQERITTKLGWIEEHHRRMTELGDKMRR